MYIIQPTSGGGRGAIATQFLAKGTQVLRCPGPYAHVVLRKFRKEVCEWCFRYAAPLNKWTIKALCEGKRETGLWFCSETCRAASYGEKWILEVFARFEMEVVRTMKLKNGDDETPSVEPANISAEYLDRVWASVDDSSPLVLNEFEVDTAKFLLVALVSKVSNGLGSWTDFLSLQNNELAYARHKPYILASHLKVFRFLRIVCASSVLKADLDTPEVVRAILGRDPGNVFGIWEDTESNEAEMFGWAAYVAASFFNHGLSMFIVTAEFINLNDSADCSPNLKKRRLDRTIEFYTLRDVRPGEELCISYISELDEDRNRLFQDWFFQCRCKRCLGA